MKTVNAVINQCKVAKPGSTSRVSCVNKEAVLTTDNKLCKEHQLVQVQKTLDKETIEAVSQAELATVLAGAAIRTQRNRWANRTELSKAVTAAPKAKLDKTVE